MNLAYSRLKEFLPELNERTHTPRDFWRQIERTGANVVHKAQKKRGYYATNGKEDYIFLAQDLADELWLEAAFHEMVHLILHFPCAFLFSKQQTEARSLALIALLPQTDLPRLVRIYAHLETGEQLLVYERLKVLEFYNL